MSCLIHCHRTGQGRSNSTRKPDYKLLLLLILFVVVALDRVSGIPCIFYINASPVLAASSFCAREIKGRGRDRVEAATQKPP